MSPKTAPEKTYQEGLQEGYRNGVKEGYRKGYDEGTSASAVVREAPGHDGGPRHGKKLLALCAIFFLVGAILSGVVFNGLGYRRGESAGKAAGRQEAQEEASRNYLPLLEERYAQGVEDGKRIGYEQGVAETESRYGINTAEPDGKNDGQEEPVLFSRSVNNGTTQAPSEEVKKIQARLIALGYLKDQADGVYGSKTENAVKQFQSANGLPETGEVDKKTYDMLFSDEEPVLLTTHTDLLV
ncbi:MAG: hypothetical protein E7316_06010 [Clostridiales bacterium]|nr:hypothetical protein [Clostridiales bacterium]